MLWLVDRFSSKTHDTLGLLFRRGDVIDEFVAFTIEDEHRDVKMAGETRIPNGVYPLKLRTHGGFHERYKDKFSYHEGMIEICDVPGFTDVLMHIGNDEGDTAGCLLVGDTVTQNVDRKGFIGNSTSAYGRVYRKMLADVKTGSAFIEFRSRNGF